VQPELKSGGEPKTNYVSIAIFAWNEEAGIRSTLTSLFEQSLFGELARRGLSCEVLCVINGCSDNTPGVVQEFFDELRRSHLHRHAISARVENLKERGKLNAWNQFVHQLASPEAEYFFMMDADILIHRKETMLKMLEALENNSVPQVAVDRPCKDIEFKWHKTFRERLSLMVSRVTQSARAQLCGQLYCIRSGIARNIYLPRDLSACEDGFVKTLVCTDLLTRPALPERLCLAEQAEHTFEAYTGVKAILKNQKRQIIGQTIVHLLIDKYLMALPDGEKLRMGEFLREKDRTEPKWLKKLIQEHLEATRFFWQLYPGLLTQRFKTLKRLKGVQKITHLPAAVAGALVSVLPAWQAHSALKQGYSNYWPQAHRSGLKELAAQPHGWELTATTNNPQK